MELSQKLRKLAEIAEKGYDCAIQNHELHSKKFFLEILFIVNELEALSRGSSGGSSVVQRQYGKVEDKESTLIVAYYLSEYGHEGIFPGFKVSQQETIKRAAAILKVNPNTLKNQRDFFDSYTNSHRQGWKAPLTDMQQYVFDKMKVLPKKEALAVILSILSVKTKG